MDVLFSFINVFLFLLTIKIFDFRFEKRTNENAAGQNDGGRGANTQKAQQSSSQGKEAAEGGQFKR